MSLQVQPDQVLVELEQTQKLCQQLMKAPHYAKMGEVGIYAIVNKAKSMGMNPLDALNGGMYFVQGKVEMSGQSMLALIRSKGHSVSMDPKSTDTRVIMYGKRCDNNDTWRAEFGIEDAKKAGIYRNQWEKMPRVMCMWRCVSQLSRFLFSDILKGVYVQGEISDAPAFDEPVSYMEPIVDKPTITKEQAFELSTIINDCHPDYQEKVDKFMKRLGCSSINELTLEVYEKILPAAIEKNKEFLLSKKVEETEKSTEVDDVGF